MRIAINAQLLNYPDFGIRTYLKCLTDHLVKNDKKNEYVLLSDKKQNKLWEHLYLPAIVNRGGFDVFHSPDHILPLLPVKCKKVITVHDLAFLKYPEMFSFKKWAYKKFMNGLSLKRADIVIADSESTKKDLIEICGFDKERIKVVHLGVDESFVSVHDEKKNISIKAKYGLSMPFLLFVGTIEPRKNISGLLDAYSIACEKHGIKEDLVIVGKKGWLYEPIFKKINGSKYRQKIKVLENVISEDLPAIYSSAELFVYPSLYEGFGLPPLEAMACGTPVITSNVSSLPEVVGDAAIMIDPNNSDELADQISKVLNDKDLQKRLREKGFERAKLFSWDKSALETIKVYEEVLK